MNNSKCNFSFKTENVTDSNFRDIYRYNGSVTPLEHQLPGTGDVFNFKQVETVYSPEDNRWIPNRSDAVCTINVPAPSQPVNLSSTLSGKYHHEGEAEVLRTTESGKDKLLATAKLRIKEISYVFCKDGTKKEMITILVYHEKWKEPKAITVLAEEYKNLFPILRRKFPGIVILPGNGDGAEEYLANIYEEAERILKTKYVVEARGWIELNGKITYAHGVDTWYDTAPIPDITGLYQRELLEIFKTGLGFLDVGHRSSLICILFLFAHLGVFYYWFEKANTRPNFCLLLSGETGILKTAVATELVSPFETKVEKKRIRFSGTQASIRKFISQSQDTTILVDDFSNTERQAVKLENAALEDIIRIVGDGIMPSKMNDGSALLRSIRVSIILTGETDGNLSHSSALRCLRIHAKEGDFDGGKLAEYQGTDRMSRYFALIIMLLEQYGDTTLVNYINENLQIARKQFENFGARRMVDAAAILSMVASFLCFLGKCLDMDEEEVTILQQRFYESICAIISENAHESKKLSPAIGFVYALGQLLDQIDEALVAANEMAYTTNEAKYLGFRDNDKRLWLKFDKAYKLVLRYWKEQGKDFLSTSKQIKEDLAKKGLIQTATNSRGRTDYVRRSKQAPRKWFTVFYEDKFWQVIDACEY